LIAHTADIVVVPDDIDIVQLAMVGINPMTALLLLRSYGDPFDAQPLDRSDAGNSAVGEYLIKLARRFGWKTVSVVRREAAAELVRGWVGIASSSTTRIWNLIWPSHWAMPNSTSSSTPSAAARRGSSPTACASRARWSLMRLCPGKAPRCPCLS